MKKIINGIVVVVVIVVGLAWLGRWAQPRVARPSNQLASAPSALAVAPSAYDFGTISMANGLVSRSFTVSNPTNQEIRLTQIVTSCMCTTAYLETASGEQGPFGMPGHGGPTRAVSEVIKPGEARAVRVVFDPGAHGPAGVGPIERVVELTEAGGATRQLAIKALVTP